MRVIGTFLVLCALIGLFTILLGSSDSSSETMSHGDRAYYIRLGLLGYGLPGAVYLLLAQFLIRRKLWAAIASLLLTAGALLVVLIVAVIIGVAMSQSPWELAMLIPIGLIELLLAALAWLLFLLARSIAPIRRRLTANASDRAR
jgi:hypothetical protein